MTASVRAHAAVESFPPWPLVVGLLGGVASGKSTVARLLADAGYEVLVADELAKDVLEGLEIRPWLLDTFGDDVVRDGRVETRVIADKVFRDEALRRELEARIHPEVRLAIARGLRAAAGRNASVVLDVPLLLEGGYAAICDVLVFVEVSAALREERAIARGMDAQDWRRRESSQLPIDDKRARADLVVANEGDERALEVALRPLLEHVRQSVSD